MYGGKTMSRLTRKINENDYIIYCEYIEKTNELFEQFNKPLGPEEYYKEEPYKMEDRYCLEDAMNKLGKLEDLMQEYNINSIQELENLLASKFIAGGFRSAGKSIVAKGILYNELSKEFGCSLEVVFKAMTMGILVKNHEDLIEIGYSDRRDKYVYFSTEEIYLKNWQSHGTEKTTNRFQITYGDDGEWCVYLEEYQKTWWLKGEKDD